jgi:hypothetical protein
MRRRHFIHFFALPILLLFRGENDPAQGLTLSENSAAIQPTLAMEVREVSNWIMPDHPGLNILSGPISTAETGWKEGLKFSAPRGFYSVAFELEISNATPGGTILYTLDGSEPSLEGGLVYAAPLKLDRSTVVRAVALNENQRSRTAVWMPGTR